MKQRYLILFSLILTIGLAGLSGFTTGCSGALDDPGQITIDGSAPGGIFDTPIDQGPAAQILDQKDLIYLNDLKCPKTEERDLAELLKYLPKDCGQLVMLSDISTFMKDESIRSFITGIIERSMIEDNMRDLIRDDEKYNQGRFPNGMSESDVESVHSEMDDDLRIVLQNEASEGINAENDEILSFFISLLGSQTDFAMCADIEDEDPAMNESASKDSGSTPNLAHDMGRGLKGMVGMKVIEEGARKTGDMDNDPAPDNDYGDDNDDRGGPPMMVIITDAPDSKAFTALREKLASRKDFKEADEDRMKHLQRYKEQVKMRADSFDCEAMNTDGEFFCERLDTLKDGKRLYSFGKVDRLSKLSDMLKQKNAETLFSNKKLRQLIDRSSSPDFRFAVYVENPTPDAFSGLPKSAGIVSGINLENRCSEMSVFVDDERSFDMVMTLPKTDIGSLLRLIPISLSESGDDGEKKCEPSTMHDSHNEVREEEYPNENYMPSQDYWQNSESYMPGIINNDMPSYSNPYGDMDAEAPASTYSPGPSENNNVDE